MSHSAPSIIALLVLFLLAVDGRAQTQTGSGNFEELPAPTPVVGEGSLTGPADGSGTFSILESEARGATPSPEDARNAAILESQSQTVSELAESQSLDRTRLQSIPQLESSLGYRVLLQGPLHEAFGFHPTADKVVPSLAPFEPPPEIQELRPTNVSDTNLVWLSGYWTWSDLHEDFLWVSGMYRRVPPGRNWKPGYWTEVSGNFAWVTGYWADEDGRSEPYLPAPPDSQERGPDSATSSQNSFWLPGNWLYENGDYRWKDGYWTQRQSQWIWQPARYVWTPRGHLFVSGYWDFEPTQRGLLFPPVAIPPNLYAQPGFRYRAEYQIASSTNLMLHLFCHPNDLHFYWGDYYGDVYTDLGFIPWFAVPQFGVEGRNSQRPEFPSISFISHYRWKYDAGISGDLQRYYARMNQIALSGNELQRRVPMSLARLNSSSSTGNGFDTWLQSPDYPSSNNLAEALAASLSTLSMPDSRGGAASNGDAGSQINRRPLTSSAADLNPQSALLGAQSPALAPNLTPSRVESGLNPNRGSATAGNDPLSATPRSRGLFSRRRSGLSNGSSLSGPSAGEAGANPSLGGSPIQSRLNPNSASPFTPPQLPPSRGAIAPPNFPFPGFRPPGIGGPGIGPPGIGPPGNMRPPLPGRRFGRDR